MSRRYYYRDRAGNTSKLGVISFQYKLNSIYFNETHHQHKKLKQVNLKFVTERLLSIKLVSCRDS